MRALKTFIREVICEQYLFEEKKVAKKVIAAAQEKAADTTWTEPDIANEMGEIERTAGSFDVQPRMITNAAENGKLEPLDDEMWSQLENTDSFDTDTPEKAVEFAEKYNRDIERIFKGFGGEMHAPIVLIKDGEPPYLIAGNTRLMAARACGVTPDVFVIRID